MQRMITPLTALLFVLAGPAWAAEAQTAAPQHRCDYAILHDAYASESPESVIPSEALDPASKTIRIPSPTVPNGLCAPEVWRRVTDNRDFVAGGNWRPPYTSLKMQVGLLFISDVAFYHVDQAAKQVEVKTLALNRKLGLIGTGPMSEKQAEAVLAVISDEPSSQPQATAWGPPSASVPDGGDFVAGPTVREYHLKLLELREALKGFGDTIRQPGVKACLTSLPEATPKNPGDSVKSVSLMRGIVADMTKPCLALLWTARSAPSANAPSVLDFVDPALAAQVEADTEGVDGALTRLHEMIQKNYPSGGVQAFVAATKRAATEEKSAKLRTEQHKKVQSDMSAKLEGFKKAFGEKTSEELSSGIDRRTDLSVEGKTQLKAEYAGGTVQSANKKITYSVVDKAGAPKVLAEIPVPVKKDLTVDKAAEAAKVMAADIMDGNGFKASLSALVAAVVQPEAKPAEKEVVEAPVAAADGSTPTEQVKKGVPLWRKLIDPFHGMMEKYKKRQLHELAKEAGQESRARQAIAAEEDGYIGAAQERMIAKFSDIDGDPELSPEGKKNMKEKARQEVQTAVEAATKQAGEKIEILKKEEKERGQKVEQLDAVVEAAYDDQIRGRIPKIREAYMTEDRDALAEETGFGKYHVDPDSLKNVFVTYLKDRHIDGYFAAKWEAGKDAESLAACRKSLGFVKSDSQAVKQKFNYSDPTQRRVDNRCVHADLVAYIKGLKGTLTPEAGK